MCAPSQGAMLPYGLKVPSPYFPFGPASGLTQAHLSALDLQRSQLNDYNVRVQFGLRNYQNSLGLSPFHAYITDPYTQAYFYKHDPRARFVQEEPKPSHSYIGLIGMAILNSKEKKLVLSDIYQWILDNYPYFRTRGPGWRNSIRHNLSLNDCFIKAGRSANGKGHYWAVHPANVEDFERGDFRRRRAQRKVRRHMGLSVPDDDDSPTPSPTQPWSHHDMSQDSERSHLDPAGEQAMRPASSRSEPDQMVIPHLMPLYGPVPGQPKKASRKRLFDMASLLAPDEEDDEDMNTNQQTHINQQIHLSGLTFSASHELKLPEMQIIFPNRNIDSKEVAPARDVIMKDVHSSSNFRRTESEDDSEDDHENGEIQVTSEDDSSVHGQVEVCDGGQVQSRCKHEALVTKVFSESKTFQELDQSESLKHSSSLPNTDLKNENALDLSSLSSPESDVKHTEFSTEADDGKTYMCEPIIHNSTMKDYAAIQHHEGSNSLEVFKREADHEDCKGYEDLKSLGESCVTNTPKNTGNEYEQDRHASTDETVNKLSYRDKCEGRGDLSFTASAELENRSGNKFHFYRPEVKDSLQSENPSLGDWNFGPKDYDLTECDRRSQADKRLLTSEAPVSDPVRISNDPLRWTEIKSAISRDRLSAFSTFSAGNHSIYTPFQFRNFPLGSQRLLPTAVPMRAGVPAQLVYLSAPSTSTFLKGLDADINKSNHKITTNNCGNNNIAGTGKCD